ncbi:MAG: CpaE family protein [Alphaproteobacteria bacterium]
MNIPVRAMLELERQELQPERVPEPNVIARGRGMREGRANTYVPLHAYLIDAATEVTVESLAERLAMSIRVQGGGIAAAVDYFRANRSPKCLIVDVSDAADIMGSIDALAEVCEPETKVIAIGDRNDIALYRQMQAAGIADYLIKPVTVETLFAAVETVLHQATAGQNAPDAELGKLIAFIGSRGGVGTSTLALNCGALIAAEKGREVAIADLDLYYGTIPLSLDLDPGYGLREALEHPNRLDKSFLNHVVVKAGERLSILGAEEGIDDAFTPTSDSVSKLLIEMRRNFEFVIADFSRSDANRWATYGESANLVIVTDLSLAGLRDTSRLLGLAQASSGLAEVAVIANKAGGDRPGDIDRADFEKALGRPIDFLIPDEPRALAAAVRAATTLANSGKSAKITGSLRRVVDRLAGESKDVKRSAFWHRVIKK